MIHPKRGGRESGRETSPPETPAETSSLEAVPRTRPSAANPAALLECLQRVALRLHAEDWAFLDRGIRTLEAELAIRVRPGTMWELSAQVDKATARAEKAEAALRANIETQDSLHARVAELEADMNAVLDYFSGLILPPQLTRMLNRRYEAREKEGGGRESVQAGPPESEQLGSAANPAACLDPKHGHTERCPNCGFRPIPDSWEQEGPERTEDC